MKIGTHELSNQLFVAPMAGVTDRPFRQLCKKLGAGYAVSEMIASNATLWNSEKTQRRANHVGDGVCVVAKSERDPERDLIKEVLTYIYKNI